MTNRAVIIQTNYIPWKGYFDLLAHADTVVFFDSVQSTKNDWRNRNIIKTQTGKTFLTIPIRHSNSLRIREVEIASKGWHLKHLRTLTQAYARAPFAAEVMPLLAQWYKHAGSLNHLSAINLYLITQITQYLGMKCHFIDVNDVMSDEEHDTLQPTARLVEVCRRVGAAQYLSGPSASHYMNLALFRDANIGVEWFNYDGYPKYPQLHGAFDPAVSILDLLLMNGPHSARVALRDRNTNMEAATQTVADMSNPGALENTAS